MLLSPSQDDTCNAMTKIETGEHADFNQIRLSLNLKHMQCYEVKN